MNDHPQKIPDFILLAESRKEVKKLEIKISNLEDDVSRYRGIILRLIKEIRRTVKLYKSQKKDIVALDKEARKELQEGMVYRDMKQKNKKLEKTNKSLVAFKDKYFNLLAKIRNENQ